MTTEYSRAHRQDTTPAWAAGYGSANNIVEELADTTEEIITNLTDKHAQQIEALVKLNNDILAKLTAALANNASPPAPAAASMATVRNGLRNARTQKSVYIARKGIRIIPMINVGNLKPMHQRAWQDGLLPRPLDGARGRQ